MASCEGFSDQRDRLQYSSRRDELQSKPSELCFLLCTVFLYDILDYLAISREAGETLMSPRFDPLTEDHFSCRIPEDL